MYIDKLDGRIDNEFFDRKAGEFRAQQCRIMRDIEAHQAANRSYIEEGIQLLELAQRRIVCSKISRRAKNGNCWILYFRTAAGRTGNWKPSTGNPLT